MTLQAILYVQIATAVMQVVMIVLILLNLRMTLKLRKMQQQIKERLDAGISISVSGPYLVEDPDEADKPKYDA
jgi:hypothetical protein